METDFSKSIQSEEFHWIKDHRHELDFAASQQIIPKIVNIENDTLTLVDLRKMGFVPLDEITEIQRYSIELAIALIDLFQRANSIGLRHMDIHSANIMYDGKIAVFVDFEMCFVDPQNEVANSAQEYASLLLYLYVEHYIEAFFKIKMDDEPSPPSNLDIFINWYIYEQIDRLTISDILGESSELFLKGVAEKAFEHDIYFYQRFSRKPVSDFLKYASVDTLVAQDMLNILFDCIENDGKDFPIQKVADLLKELRF